MPPTDLLLFSRLPQLLTTVLPDRLQKPVAGLPDPFFSEDQRLVHQRGQQIQYFFFIDISTRPDGFGCLEREAAGENLEPAEQDALLLGEQVVAPVHRRP